ncbi:MAG: hypothetical protein KJ558_07055 [Gammaproteobacteria bacterium]|nr:hypothetical protein [Gammaproteobacteria bacterium]MBU1654574.1 hypothetical protein [Gammaproteobacteria bacterium]MBU1961966.1 hypothetical protein [Gammaproteobacteria bacterium]
MKQREQLSVWMPPGTKARIKALAGEREPIASVLCRGLDALEHQSPTDGKSNLISRLEALEARVQALESIENRSR